MKKEKIITVCPKYLNCIIFNAKVIDEHHAKLYKNLYCSAGRDKYSRCKRYITSEKTGVAPPDYIMPNSILSVEEILEDMKQQGLIK